jgi:uncharacterized protein
MPSRSGQVETVIITGASSGIGRALARRLAGEGARLILVARRAERLGALSAELHRLGAVSCLAFPLDLAAPEAPRRLWSAIQALGWHVDLLVNNAGFGDRRPFREIPLERQDAMLRLNVNALVTLTGLCLPPMRERGRGGIIQVASTAAFQPGPGMASYYASKAFVLAFGEALHEEERAFGITVTTLCPGPTRTEFGALAGEARSALMRQGQAEAEDVAHCGLRALRKGRALAFPNLGARLGSALPRLLPRSWMRRLVHRLQ